MSPCHPDVLRASRKPRKGSGLLRLTQSQALHVPNIQVVFLHLPLFFTPLDPLPAYESQLNSRADESWQPVWLPACLPVDMLKCTDFHILMLRSGVVWKHVARDCWGEQGRSMCKCACIYSFIQNMHNSAHHHEEMGLCTHIGTFNQYNFEVFVLAFYAVLLFILCCFILLLCYILVFKYCTWLYIYLTATVISFLPLPHTHTHTHTHACLFCLCYSLWC